MRFSSLFSALLLAALLGCGDDRLSVYPVSGKVSVNGQPAEGATVIFYTQNTDLRRPGVPIPKGTVAADGTFKLTTYQDGDGAPAGDYAVAINWMQVTKPSNDPEQQVEVDRLGGRYSTPDKSGLTAKIEATSNELPPFELK
jgi:hypothetical protein